MTKGRIFYPIKRTPDIASPSVAVVIPTLNVEKTLTKALESIQQQTAAVDEVIVVDAGSTDGTIQIAEASSLSISVLSSERGRGAQIATGIEAAQSDWVLVLHADAVLSAYSVEYICLLYTSPSPRDA